MFISGQGLDWLSVKLSWRDIEIWTSASLEPERGWRSKVSVSFCLVLIESKWTVMMGSFSSWCSLPVWQRRGSQSATHLFIWRGLSAFASAECFPPYSLSKCAFALLPEGSQKWLKGSCSSRPQSLHNGKTNGHIHLLGLTEERMWCWDGGQMNRPVLDPWRIQRAGGVMSCCSTIYQASSSRWAITAIDGASWCRAEIWGSLHRAGGNLRCCCCTLNTNSNKWIVLVHLFPVSAGR